MSNSPNYHDFGPPSLNDQSNNNNQYNLSMLYFGFLVVATAGLILAIYHCIVFNFCTDYPSSLLLRHSTSSSGGGGSGSTPSHHGFNASKLKVVELESVLFKYNKKEKGVQLQTEQEEEEEEEECVVCLSVFEEGEDVRKLVKCKHCFHAPCIDMWLYSHFDCPLCRATLGDAAAAAAAAATGVSVPPSEGNSGARYSDSGVLPV